MQDKIEKCFEKAKRVIEKNITPNGIYASAGKNGYNAVWARDSMISAIGASVVNNEKFREAFRRSITTLAENQAKNGEIPNCVDKWSQRKPHVDFKSIDSTLWFLIGNHVYRDRYYDDSLIKKYQKNIQKAMNWLDCQQEDEIGMLFQLPTTDWFDAFPHRYGHTINTQALYYKVLNLIWDTKRALKLKTLVNKDPERSLWKKDYYYSYRWKNHGKYKEIGDFFDSLGNLLAIVFDLADEKMGLRIIDYIKKNRINEPFPVKSLFPPIQKDSKYWQDYYMNCDASKPYHYSNGGIWGYIGGFYILALIKLKKIKEAEKELEKLAERNLNGNFPEWTNPITKKHYGKMQAWEAGMYILAYESLKENRVLI